MNWLHELWFGYFWPSLQGNGPEALVQTVVYGAIALILIPPIRRAIERFAKRHVDSIKAHAENLHAETRAHAEDLHKTLHARLDKLEGKPPDTPPGT